LNPVEKARIGDVEQVHKLINYCADRGEMIARSLSEIYENIRDFFVVRQGEQVVGCVALHISWLNLAEVRSLAVAEDNREQGIGAQLVDVCLKEAEDLGAATVFCLTYKPAFFEKFGFSQVDKAELPRKIWTECYRCPKFPDCDEVALIHRSEVKG
jgi:amino-acid N-acetyltransferase